MDKCQTLVICVLNQNAEEDTYIYSVSKKKRKPSSNPKSLKIEKKNHEEWMIAYLFFFHIVHWSFILGQGWLLSNHFCKACQNCLCCESSRKCHHAAQTTPTWTKTILTCFTKLIAVQPSMAEYE